MTLVRPELNQGHVIPQWSTPPPPNRRRNPNKSAIQIGGPIFLAKQVPSALDLSPSFWPLCSWSHVQTQNMSQFKKKPISRSVHDP